MPNASLRASCFDEGLQALVYIVAEILAVVTLQ